VTLVALPEDNVNQWTGTNYDDRLFTLGTQKPDIASWGQNPIQNVLVYDDNGNVTETWQADPLYGGSPLLLSRGGAVQRTAQEAFDLLEVLIQFAG
jgi:hypothetical protein